MVRGGWVVRLVHRRMSVCMSPDGPWQGRPPVVAVPLWHSFAGIATACAPGPARVRALTLEFKFDLELATQARHDHGSGRQCTCQYYQ